MRVVLAFLLLVAVGISFFFFSRIATESQVTTEPRTTTEQKPQSEPESIELVVKNSYEEGIATGYRAVLNQMGEPTPKIIRYASEHYEENKEDFDQGYVEGYHKAADMWSKRIISEGDRCPCPY